MSDNYFVNWSDKSMDDAKRFQAPEAKTSKDAYLLFVEENVYRSVAVTVRSEGEGIHSEFDDHIEEHEDIELNDDSSTSNDSRRFERLESISRSSSSTAQTQEEILKQLKQINWGIRVGFLFIMLVVTGIIKPGVFG